jgi:uncharacterized paraquat-inducible protein A
MYCSSCGAAVPPGVSYCNRCGTELSAKGKSPLGMPLEYLVWAIVTVAVVGLGANIGLMALMKESLHLENGVILGITLVCLLPFLAAEAVFLWLLLRSQCSPKYQINQPRTVATSELGAAQPRVLQAQSPSVTEHTTHTLEPARSDRSAQ